jgi:nitroreductase
MSPVNCKIKVNQADYEMLARIIKTRRSIRRYKPEVPPRNLILNLIDAARYAPSPTNLQPWLFLIITKKEVVESMAQAVCFKLDHLSSKEKAIAEKDVREFGRQYFLFFRKAPVVIAPLFKPYPATVKLGYELTAEESTRRKLVSIESTAAATQNLLLAAHSFGLGACWLDGALVARKEIEAILGVKSPWELMCLIALGYPDEQPKPPRRKKTELIARFIV